MGNNTNDVREIFKKWRSLVTEARKEIDGGGVPYAKNDELYKVSVNVAKTQLGAEFDGNTPMYYYEEDGDVSLSFTLPDLNNAKVQYRYKDPNGQGCFLWLDSLSLNEDAVKKIQKIHGFYKNWKKELSVYEDLRPLSLMNQQ